ncbi:ricin-type beta-trefoil lectin domain protein [Glycomyces paridis]|uniref:Right-handed parallel beta-helix repeat-containing protein n=1 Tax=Glycomyces paridis TaxID=2126555 RepID=A0A4S8PLZ9_9ACTN|nr:ricin-type beta-trefoil lectin domain protein [Glycomyces paridis]THV29569.1 right-handed parallel beta-helix repeat-containing protein [Glycomyces paridis]
MRHSPPGRLRAPALAAALLLAVAGALAGPGATPALAQTAHDIYVSPDGNDGNAGTSGQPLKTLTKAQEKARQAAAAGDGDVTVVLQDGTYRLSAPLRFTADDSGRNGHTVTWRAADGADPVVTGAQAVTGWVLDDAATGIYRADVGTGFDTRQLYVDGVPAQRARTGIAPSDMTLNASGFTLNNGNFDYLASLPDQRRIELQALLSFTNRFAPVQGISGRTVTMQQPSWNNNTYGYDAIQNPFRTPQFFLLNSKRFLDQAGEWYLDTGAGRLYYKPLAGQSISTAKVELPRLETLIEVGGTYGAPVRALEFSGLTFTGTTWLDPGSNNGYANQQTGTFITGVQAERPSDAFTSCRSGCRGFEAARNSWAQTPAAVQVSAADGITFADNTFVNLGSVGLGIGNDANAHSTGVGLGAKNILVSGNTFTAGAGGGIVVGGVRPDAHHPSDSRMLNSDIEISDNSVYATALEYLDHAAILGTYATRLTIDHNYVSDMPYSGINIGFGWGANDPGGSPEYLNRGLYDFQPIYQTPTASQYVQVTGNHVRNVVQTLFDAGCIYSLSAHPNSTISGNHCENSGQLGMYFDEGSRYFTLSGNVFRNTYGQWAHANNQNSNLTGDMTVTGNYTTNSAITGLVDGQRGNTVRDNTTFNAGSVPAEAARIIADAGPDGDGDGSGGTGALRSVSAGRCLDVPGQSTTDGTQVQIYDCWSGANQQWTLTASGELTVYSGGSRKCLDAFGGGTANGTQAIIWTCHGGANQRWNRGADGTITNAASGLCLDVSGAATANGTKVILWTCNGGANQRWTLA